MGLGDELLVTGIVKRAQRADSRRVRVLDRYGAPRWHPLWDGNPRIAKPAESGDFQKIVNGSGERAYIEGKTAQRWTWRACDNEPGEIYLTAREQQLAAALRPEIVIEPTIKERASPNKQWPRESWKRFAEMAMAEGYRLTQLGPQGARVLPGVRWVRTDDYRLAAAVLSAAKLYVGHEGYLHHCAAAFGVPAIVIRGAFISPGVTGYAGQRDFFEGEGLGCGSRLPCQCCAAAMARIEPEAVFEAMREMLQ